MTNIRTAVDHNSQLQIFYSDNPLSEKWNSHSLNPVIFDSNQSRNGGLIIENEKIFRVFQRQDFDNYGSELGVSRINLITPTKYSEECLFEIKPLFFKALKSTHTFNYHKGLVVIDFCRISKQNN